MNASVLILMLLAGGRALRGTSMLSGTSRTRGASGCWTPTPSPRLRPGCGPTGRRGTWTGTPTRTTSRGARRGFLFYFENTIKVLTENLDEISGNFYFVCFLNIYFIKTVVFLAIILFLH